MNSYSENLPKIQKKKLFVFDHIPKCAGTTMHAIFKRDLPGYTVLPCTKKKMEFVDHINNDAHDVFYCGGHDVYGMHELVGSQFVVRYFSFLRDPLKIAISSYNYTKTESSCPYGSLIDFLSSSLCQNIVNYLGGTVDEAILRLEQYAFIGFVDELEKSLAKLGEVMGVSFGAIPIKNKSQNYFGYTSGDIHFDAIEELAADYKVYNHFMKKRRSAPDKKRKVKCTDVEFTHISVANKQYQKNKIQHSDISSRLKCGDSPNDRQLFFLRRQLNLSISDEDIQNILGSPIDINIDLVFNPSQIDTVEKFRALKREMVEAYLPLARYDKYSFGAMQLKRLTIKLAHSKYAAQNNLWREMFCDMLDIFPGDADLLRCWAVMEKINGNYTSALNILSNVKEASRNAAYDNVYLDAFMGAGGNLSNPNDRIAEEIFARMQAIAKFVSLNQDISGRVRLKSLPRKKTLIIQSAPAFVLHDILSEACTLFPSITVLAKEGQSSPPFADVEYYYYKGWFKADGKYHWESMLSGEEFTNIVLLNTDYNSLNNLANFLDYFVRPYEKTAFAYPLLNAFADSDEKTLIPLTG